jgi:hypothetical protein
VAPLTRLEEASSDDSPSTFSDYNHECPHVKEMSSYELLLDFNLPHIITKCIHLFSDLKVKKNSFSRELINNYSMFF